MNNIIETPKLGIGGTVLSWEVINTDGSVARACYKPKCNMILNGGLDMLSNNTYWNEYTWSTLLDYFAIGTGTALPTVTDTTLGNESHRETAVYNTWNVDSSSVAGSSPYYVTRQRGVQTTLGVLNGTYTEIGFSPNSGANGALFCKFRLTDQDGNPVSLAVASNQQLRLKYLLTIQLTPATPTYYTTSITGIGSFGYTACWQDCSNISAILSTLCAARNNAIIMRESLYTFANIGSVVSFLSGNYKANGYTQEAYVPGSYTIYKNISYAVTDAVWINKALSLEAGAYSSLDATALWVVAFDPANYINKPNTNILTMRFAFSWGRS